MFLLIKTKESGYSLEAPCPNNVYPYHHNRMFSYRNKKSINTFWPKQYSVWIMLKGNGYTLRGTNCKNLFYHTSEKVSSLKGKNLLSGSKFFPFRVDPFVGRGLSAEKQNRKSKKLSPL